MSFSNIDNLNNYLTTNFGSGVKEITLTKEAFNGLLHDRAKPNTEVKDTEHNSIMFKGIKINKENINE